MPETTSHDPGHDPGAGLDLPLDWSHATADVPPGGLDLTRTATADERQALAAALGIVGCEALVVRYRLKRAPAECYRLSGDVKAEVVQACVVTLAPVHQTVAVPLDIEFQPAGFIETRRGGAIDLEDQLEIEPIENGRLAVGRIVFEEVAAGLDPYPRRPGAAFEGGAGDGANDKASGAATASPFAVLAKLKPGGKGG